MDAIVWVVKQTLTKNLVKVARTLVENGGRSDAASVACAHDKDSSFVGSIVAMHSAR